MTVSNLSKATLVGLAIAAAGGAVALANEPVREGPVAVYHGPIQGNPNAAACAAGFTAAPGTIQGSNPYNQSYTCTGPAIVCSAHFTPQPSVAGTIPGGPGQFGQTIYGSPVTIQHGRMVYTCAEPPSPPQ